MEEKFEKIAKAVYRSWKAGQKDADYAAHPDEETLACFLEGKLEPGENEGVVKHLASCEKCAESFALQVKLQDAKEIAVPAELRARIKNCGKSGEVLELVLKIKEKYFELINTAADILLGQEVVPAPVLRSRNIKDFKDEITILKDFAAFRVEIKLANKGEGVFSVQVSAKEKQTSRVLKDVRITLLKDDVEMESCLAESGLVIFEHVLLGKYAIQLATIDDARAYVILEVRA